MKTMDFIELYLRNGGSITSVNRNGWVTFQWQAFARLTALINYGCDFQHGKCKDDRSHLQLIRGAGCCGRCAEATGYLDSISNRWADLTKTARLFNKKTGFWRKGKGCALPLELRSSTCLGYTCDEHYGRRTRLLKSARRLLKLIDGKPPRRGIDRVFQEIKLSLQKDEVKDKVAA